MGVYGLETRNNFSGFMDSNLPAEFVLAAGFVDFNSLVYNHLGNNTSSSTAPGYTYVPITLTKYAKGLQMIGTDPDGYHTLASSVYMVAGTSRGSIPMHIDGRAEWSSKKHWSENYDSITINYLVIPPGIDGSLAAGRISGRVYVLLVGELPDVYDKVDYGLRLFSSEQDITFDSALMPSNARHIIHPPSEGYYPYSTPSSLNVGDFPEGVKLAPCSILGQGRASSNYFVNMSIQFNSMGTKCGLRPNGFAWTNPWQSHYGPHCLTSSESLRIFYASDYF